MGDLQYTKGQPLAVAIGNPVRVAVPDDSAEPGPGNRFLVHDATFEPLASTPCKVKLPSGRAIDAVSDGQGWISVALPKGTRKVTIIATPPGADPVTFTVEIPPDDDSTDGFYTAHLKNYGFDRPGESDQQMYMRFQIAAGIGVTGKLDDATKDAVKKLHEGDGSLGDGLAGGDGHDGA